MRLLIHIFISQCNLFFSLNLHKNCKKKFLPTNITGQKIKFYEEKKLQKLELPRYLYSPTIRPSLTVNCFFFSFAVQRSNRFMDLFFVFAFIFKQFEFFLTVFALNHFVSVCFFVFV